MSLEVKINGERAELAAAAAGDIATVLDALEARFHEQGWHIAELRLDGQTVERERLPAGDGAQCQVLDVSVVPEAAAVRDVQSRLRESLARWRPEAESLAGDFQRGEWRSALDRLGPLLEDFQFLVTGFQVTEATLGISRTPVPSGISEPLRGLSDKIERRSWVEVSDVLLYELIPLLEVWEKARQDGAD